MSPAPFVLDHFVAAPDADAMPALNREGYVPHKLLPRKKIPADIRSLCRAYTDGDTAKRLYCTKPWGEPYRGVPAKTAAQMLVTKSREDERKLEGAVGGAVVMTAGLLDNDDIQLIEQSVFNSDDEC
jgi:hypothetical protein